MEKMEDLGSASFCLPSLLITEESEQGSMEGQKCGHHT